MRKFVYDVPLRYGVYWSWANLVGGAARDAGTESMERLIAAMPVLGDGQAGMDQVHE